MPGSDGTVRIRRHFRRMTPETAETTERRTHSLAELDARLRALEIRAISDDGLHASLVTADGQTARAVERLTGVINDPRTGLIVELDRFRAEVAADREAFRSWVRGATVVLSVVVGAVSVAAPWVRGLIEHFLGAP